MMISCPLISAVLLPHYPPLSSQPLYHEIYDDLGPVNTLAANRKMSCLNCVLLIIQYSNMRMC